MAMDGDFGGGQSASGVSAAEEAGRDFVECLANLATYEPQQALDVADAVLAQISDIRKFISYLGPKGTDPSAAADTAARGAVRAAWVAGEDAADDALGRNQRSRVREAHLLDIVERNAGPTALNKIITGLEGRRVASSQAAVVSHLHRLKAAKFITQPGSGFYDITPDGLGHLRKLRASLGALVGA